MKTYFVLLMMILAGVGHLFSQSIEDGIVKLRNENFKEARQIFSTIMSSNPKNAEAYFYMGESFYELGNVDSAMHYYKLGVDQNARGGINYVGLGKIEWNNNKKKEARDNFDRAERLGKGKDWRIPFEIGRTYLESEDRKLDIAIEKLEEAKDISRTNPEVWSVLGDAYRESNQGGKAASAYSYVLEQLKIESPEIYRKRAELFRRSRTYDEAITNLEKAIALDPGYAPAYRDLIDLYQNYLNKYEKVTPLLKKYTELVGDDIEAQTRYVGFLFRQAADYETTIMEADKVLQKSPNNYQMYRWKGYAQLETKDFAGAQKSMQRFFDLVGDNKTYFSDYDYFARAAAELGDFDGAAEKYRKALELEVAKEDVYDKIAKMYFDAKRYKEAAEAYQIKMDNVDAVSTDYFYLGFSLFVTQNYEKADENFAVVTELLPEWMPGFVYRAKTNEFLDPEQETMAAAPFHERVIELAGEETRKYGTDLINAHRYLGYAAFKNNEFEEAKLHFEKLTSIATLDSERFKGSLVESYASLGYIFLQGGTRDDRSRATEYYNKVLEIDPKNEDALSALEYLKSIK